MLKASLDASGEKDGVYCDPEKGWEGKEGGGGEEEGNENVSPENMGEQYVGDTARGYETDLYTVPEGGGRANHVVDRASTSEICGWDLRFRGRVGDTGVVLKSDIGTGEGKMARWEGVERQNG